VNDERRKKLSKTLSYYLRHAPGEIGLSLMEGGYVWVDELLDALAEVKGVHIHSAELDYIVAKCEKQRFAYSIDGEKIRANQGHSVEVDLHLEELKPPAVLYHGTVERFLMSIFEHGLKKMDRHHVHLSADRETAVKVGRRRGKPIVLEVDAGRMQEDAHKFWVSDNGVWLADSVPAKYLTLKGE